MFTTDNAENDGINTQMTGEAFRLDPAAAGPLVVYCGIALPISDVTQGGR